MRNKTRNGLFDEYQEIKSRPPDGTFDHARMTENLVKVNLIFCMELSAELILCFSEPIYADDPCYDHTRC